MVELYRQVCLQSNSLNTNPARTQKSVRIKRNSYKHKYVHLYLETLTISMGDFYIVTDGYILIVALNIIGFVDLNFLITLIVLLNSFDDKNTHVKLYLFILFIRKNYYFPSY